MRGKNHVLIDRLISPYYTSTSDSSFSSSNKNYSTLPNVIPGYYSNCETYKQNRNTQFVTMQIYSRRHVAIELKKISPLE